LPTQVPKLAKKSFPLATFTFPELGAGVLFVGVLLKLPEEGADMEF
jgi:hypothetical protein